MGGCRARRRSKRVALAQHLKNGLDQNLDVEPKAPVVDVPQIHFYAPCNLFDGGGCASQSIDLRPSRHPGFDVMAEGVVLQQSFKLVVVSQGMRPWSDQRHFSPQDVYKLRQFVNADGAQQPANSGYARIIARSLRNNIAIFLHRHGAELEHDKLTAVESLSILQK